jgi:hypothetical protein
MFLDSIRNAFFRTSVAIDIVSVIRWAGVVCLGLADKQHRQNARTGRNPILREQKEKREKARAKKAKKTFVPRPEEIEFFILRKSDLKGTGRADLARAWFLTGIEANRFWDLLNLEEADQKKGEGLTQERLDRFEELQLLTDNRLMEGPMVKSYLMGMKRYHPKDFKMIQRQITAAKTAASESKRLAA